MTTIPAVMGRPGCRVAGMGETPTASVAARAARWHRAWTQWRLARRQRLCEAGLRQLARELSPALRRDLGLPDGDV